MKIQITDYNQAESIIQSSYQTEWGEISKTLNSMPLYLKGSEQAGMQGKGIFDPVATNKHVRNELAGFGWGNLPIPEELSFLGIDVDFAKPGIILEVQFSNYPFLLNNTIRSELFSKSQLDILGKPLDVLVIITKAALFPASNSTLYYEQARNQLNSLSAHKVFDIPIRLVGLFVEALESDIPATWTTYTKSGSRTIELQEEVECYITKRRTRSTIERKGLIVTLYG